MSKATETQNNESGDDATNAPTGGGASSTAPNADLTAIGAALANGMPEVQEHAVAQAAREQESANTDPKDKNGDVFDPAVHVAGADGKGMLTVRGTWAQKRGRKGGNPAPVTNAGTVRNSTLGGPAAPPSPQQVQAQQQAQLEAQSRAAGVAAAEMLFMAGQAFGGEEWQPNVNKQIGLDERAMMHQAFGDYFVASGTVSIPPWAGLCFAVTAYAAPRFAMPKTQTRIQKIKGAVVTWWVNRKLRKAGVDLRVTKKPAEQGKEATK